MEKLQCNCRRKIHNSLDCGVPIIPYGNRPSVSDYEAGRLAAARRCAEIVSSQECADCGHGSEDGLSCLEKVVDEIRREFGLEGK
jgi:hypothetical protein